MGDYPLIPLDQLPPVAEPSRNYVLAAMLAGEPGNLTIAQLLSLAEIGDVAGLASILSAKADALQTRVDVASASTTNIGAAPSEYVNVTGADTITSFGEAAAGTWRDIRFGGSLTLTHNGDSLVLPNGGSSLVAAPGDHCVAVSMGGGKWTVARYQRASGRALSIPAASTSEQGIVELATAGEVATGTDAARVPSVAAMGNHQGVAKAWVNFNGTGTVAIRSSYNVSSISDGGVGTYGVNFATPMANANYAAAGNCSNTGGAKTVTFPPTNTFGRTVSTLGVDVFTSTATIIDADHINVIVFGG